MGEAKALSPSRRVRDATPGVDDDAVVGLMTAYMTWAIARLAVEFGVDEPPPRRLAETLVRTLHASKV